MTSNVSAGYPRGFPKLSTADLVASRATACFNQITRVKGVVGAQVDRLERKASPIICKSPVSSRSMLNPVDIEVRQWTVEEPNGFDTLFTKLYKERFHNCTASAVPRLPPEISTSNIYFFPSAAAARLCRRIRRIKIQM
jgi:hypothetical protein